MPQSLSAPSCIFSPIYPFFHTKFRIERRAASSSANRVVTKRHTCRVQDRAGAQTANAHRHASVHHVSASDLDSTTPIKSHYRKIILIEVLSTSSFIHTSLSLSRCSVAPCRQFYRSVLNCD